MFHIDLPVDTQVT